LESETVVWNSHFSSIEKENEGWILHFKNGKDFIAADGANSKTMPYLTDIKPFYSGIMV